MIYSLMRSAPADLHETALLEFRVQVLSQTVMGGVLVVTGVLMFVGAALAMVEGSM